MSRHKTVPSRVGAILLDRLPGLRPRTIDAKVLAGSIALFAVLAAYRFYDYWVTGFFVSDEYGYYYDAVHSGIYSDRWFFGWVNIYVFKALGITNVNAFSYFLPFYILVLSTATLVVFYKLLKLLGFDAKTVALSLVSSLILISFVLLSLGFLTEPMGLCMAMVGIYFLARFAKSTSLVGKIGFPFVSACFFGFAAGTREPYNAFLIAGVLIVLVLAVARRKEGMRAPRLGPAAVIVLSVAVFLIPSVFFLYVPTHAYTEQVAPLSSQLATAITSNPHTSGSAATTTTTTVVQTVTNVVTVGNSTTTTTTTKVVTTAVSSGPSYPWYKEFVITNMLLIFFGGIALGWGPICFVIGVAGFLVLLRRVRGGDITIALLFLTSLTALGSYLVVSFIYSPDPTYFSFQNYSTLIRFSDTALPAYFLMAPVVLSSIAKSRRQVTGILAVFVIFLLIAVPAYEIYAASNFDYTTSQNPFQTGYRSDAVLVRNYFSNTASAQPMDLVGFPYGWAFTPGVQNLDVDGYSIGPSSTFPHFTVANFTSERWPSFYLFVSSGEQLPSNSTSLLEFVTQTQPGNQTATPPFQLLGSKDVLTGPDFSLYEIQLSWQ